MSYKARPIEISEDNPFEHDALERKPLVDFLVGLIGRAGGPFVLALDSPWGTGKTTLVQMLRAQLKQQNFATIYFDAWKVDFTADPLVPLVAALDQLDVGNGSEAKFSKHLNKARKVVTIIAKHALITGVKASTVGLLDLEEGIEEAIADSAGDATEDIVAAFQTENKLLEKFRSELGKAVSKLPDEGKNPTLVFFIDELDRCRPTFAIQLLERIKHLFDVPNILFVLSLDKTQLEASVAAVYGAGINAPEYLRRFLDLEYALPELKGEAITKSLLVRFGLDTLFAERKRRRFPHEELEFVTFFSALADAFSLSLRTRQSCMIRLHLVLEQSMRDEYLYPTLVALLIVIRVYAKDLYNRLCQGLADATEVLDFLEKLPAGQELLDRFKAVIEVLLVLADPDEVRRKLLIDDLKADASSNDTLEPEYIEKRRSVLNQIAWLNTTPPSISDLAPKIDLADGIRNPWR